ncbi:V-type ATP synthase subunit I [Thiocystis violascens]|uniref:Archaeal/vacuolar-type H+-ATPase subunit I n=1 Tax=Thiocystis violascens (strain ATCC 17096 / DSM 198 / 6111) TaxID=765911 RepID=I3Y9T1_THIV6|nr:V-type ATPase 116kDa subunit family protein [Thiocystis violascens]AFL73749.1 archaeal/vacuolar-type H+-ATPase subunit I [Thiocystis violascens DSM 198]
MLMPMPMKHVRLLVLTEDLPRASMALAATESFHPDTRPPEESRLDALPGREYRETFNQAQSRYAKIARLIPLDTAPDLDTIRVVDQEELSALNVWLGGLWDETSRYEEDFHRLDEKERLIKEQQAALENFSHLNIDLGMLRNKTRFLDFHVGLVPRENLRQLEGAVSLAGSILSVYMQQGDHAHVVIVGPGDKESALAPLLAAASFQTLPIPLELDRKPAELQEDFANQRLAIAAQRQALQEDLERWSKSFRDRLLAARHTLMLAEPLVTLDASLRSAGNLAHLAGWVPAPAVAELERTLRETLTHPFDLASRDPLPDERKLVPTVPLRSRLLAPFALLVNQYGIPSYGEVDPTPLFAVTFLLMFGMMFGDLGHGAVIALAALWARGRLPKFYLFGVFAGLSSMVFGLLFGSVFGYEDILPALWMSPLHDPILMLKVALGWGIGFIVVACLLGIYNRLAIGDPLGALLERHGLVNLLFYLSFLWGGYGLATTGAFGTLPALLVIGSLLTLAAFQWHHLTAPTGEKALVVAIETLDTVIVYLSNTLSFLRVSAFSLNHVALSLAIFTLAGMMGSFGHIVTVILGNVFILVLEGGIVMIQVMRLQYYEGFSRYFSGEGHAFLPLRLRQISIHK